MDTTSPSPETNSQPEAGSASDSMFGDLSKLTLSQDFAASLGVKRVLTTVPVRKPSKEIWFQVHSDPEYRLNTCVIELKEDRETYLVDRALWPELASEPTFSPRALFTCITKQGILFIWPMRLPGPDGKLDSWSESSLEHASAGIGNWIRVSANMSLGAYERLETEAGWLAPVWPDLPFNKILAIAFKGHFISTLDHAVIKNLRGRI